MTQTAETLARLVAFPSISSASNHDIIDYIETFLTERGFTLIRIADATQPKAGLLAHIGPAGAGGVMLSGHTDVVPTSGQNWSSDPFTLRREGSRLYGRGTTDMKGYLAAMLTAADLASTATLKQPLKLAFSWDEEIGCLGIPQMLPHIGQIGAPAACFVGEPTSMNIATGHKGKLALTATCHGTAGHSANAPDYLNALHLAADFITALRRQQSDLASTGASDAAYDTPYSTLHAGILQGGTALNIVPERATVTFELRHLPSDDPTAILARLNTAAQAITAPHPAAKITITQTSAYPGLQTAIDAPVTHLAQSLLPADTRLTKVAYGTEAGHISAFGIPTVVCGPGNMAQGHKGDEFIEIDQLAQCDAMFAALINRLSAGSI